MTDLDDDHLLYSSHNRQQHTAYLTLGRLLHRAHKAVLPPLKWGLPDDYSSGLIGEVKDDWATREQLQARYDEWCAFFGGHLKHQDDIVWSGGEVTKTAHVVDVDWLRGQHVVIRVKLRDRRI
ncbi:hypothetical protein AB0E08_08275 [Streptomyces sp. NPDC048281]|uniref:hypothetical protein n=1 Tax=Streptomyces sp. NPDC048281 TaxID=3154715 RepID=UPI00343CA841